MNCIIVDDDELVLHTLETLIGETDFLTLVKSCKTAAEASAVIKKEEVDLIFLDVKLPGMNGLDFLKSFEGNKPLVIMITADKSAAAEAYNLDVSDFILKPITRARFLKAVSKSKRSFAIDQHSVANDALFVKVNSVLRRVNMQDILYIEAMADYLTVHIANQKYVLKSTMKNMLDKLPEKEFIRVHNSFIVRIDKISSIEDSNLVLDKKIIPISRNRRKALMDSLNLI